jgi:hypothetical protein
MSHVHVCTDDNVALNGKLVDNIAGPFRDMKPFSRTPRCRTSLLETLECIVEAANLPVTEYEASFYNKKAQFFSLGC